MLLLVVVVDVDGTVFCETMAEYCRTGNAEVVAAAVVVAGYAKCGGALVDNADAGVETVGNVDLVVVDTLGDCCCNCEEVFGDDT